MIGNKNKEAHCESIQDSDLLDLLGLHKKAMAVDGVIVKDQADLMQSIYAKISRAAEAIKEFTVENAKLGAMSTAAEQEVESINQQRVCKHSCSTR